MTVQHQPVPDLWALLIGIDCYMPNQLPDGTFYRSLAGCVRDVRRVEQSLRSEFGLTDGRLTRLTASCGDDMNPSESPEEWPTYKNIVQGFRKLEESAQPGEQIYIHYSGHGGKVKTLPVHRVLIPHKEIDEALVPADLGNDEGRYLRDIELAFLLRKLVDKGLYVTIVLDSCHAGSTTRGESSVRGTNAVNTLNRSSLVASDQELADNWLRLPPRPRRVTRGVSVSSDWLPDPRGYVLLAACSSHEGAHEYPFDGVNKQGVLTYWLLESFRKFGDGVTFRTLHRYIHAKVSRQFRGLDAQNPQLEGEGDRVVFGREAVQLPFAFVVLDVDEANRQVTLSAGRVHGLGAEARFALYSAGQADFKRSDTPLAIAQIIESGTTSSLARLVNRSFHGQVEQGDRAVLLIPGTDTPRFTVRFLAPEETTPLQAAAVEQIVQLLKSHNEGYVQLAEGDEAPDFVTTVTPDGLFRICDSSGIEIPNMRNILSVADAEAPPLVVERLLHLAKYRSARELKNFDPLSALSRKFSVELMGVQADYKPGMPLRPHAFAETQDIPTVKVGEWLIFRAHNHYTVQDGIALNVTVLNLRPDWSIRQVFPSRSGLFDTVEAGQKLLLPFCVELPPGYNAGIDLIKFFATIEPADFHFLELPPLEPRTARGAVTREVISRGSNYDDESQTRDMVFPQSDADDWNTRQFEVRVTR